MRRIDRGQTAAPDLLTQYRAVSADDPNGNSWNNVDTDVLNAVRQALSDLQQSCCAYCGVELDEVAKTKIEHVHPRKEKDPPPWEPRCDRSGTHGGSDETAVRPVVAWDNLLLCCDGNEASKRPKRELHCDSYKAEAHRCELPFPDEPRLMAETLLDVDDLGRVFPSDDVPEALRPMLIELVGDATQPLSSAAYRGVLNLNCSALTAARRRYADALIAERDNEGSRVGLDRHFPWLDGTGGVLVGP